MKTSIISILFVIGISVNSSVAQPLVVTKGLNQRYPTAKNIKWVKEQNLWKAEFLLGGRKTSASFDFEGNWFSAKQEIELEEIGVEEVKTAIKKDFSNCKIISIKIINEAISGTWYEVEGTCGSESKKQSYDYKGLPPPKIS